MINHFWFWQTQHSWLPCQPLLSKAVAVFFLPEVPSTENTKATKKEINQTKHNHGICQELWLGARVMYSAKMPV